jgi:hypothetical protein
MRHLTDDILLSVKDGVRNLRYAIRAEAGPALTTGYGHIPAPVTQSRAKPEKTRRRYRLANFLDRVFTEVESDALSIVSPRRERLRDAIFPQPVTAYFARGDRDDAERAERLFARAHYHAAKALLRDHGLANVLIFEHAIGRTRDVLLRQHADLIARARASRASRTDKNGCELRVRLCAALTCALIAARPIKEIDPRTGASTPRHLIASPNAWCFIAAGLSTAIASLQEECDVPVTSAEIVESARAITDVRFARFAAALEASDPIGALAAEFHEVLPFLP